MHSKKVLLAEPGDLFASNDASSLTSHSPTGDGHAIDAPEGHLWAGDSHVT